MCGISGIYAAEGRLPAADLEQTARRMAQSLGHRGPDRLGSWVSAHGGVAFGHTRLSIVDLTAAGEQPMTSANGRWTITYNGEIYNVGTLSDAIGMPRSAYRGHSDTEVLVESIAAHGVCVTLERAVGMFAFAAWDHQRSELWLARDRFGEKPVYYAFHRAAFVFGSELKALREVPGFSPSIDRDSLMAYFRWTNIPAPRTVYEGVRKLPPGHLLRVCTPSSPTEPEPYWSPIDEAASAQCLTPPEGSLDEFEDLFGRVVADRMVADVPLGAFLSGGIDSSAVVAMMQRASTTQTRTFTVSFPETAFDESHYAGEVARCLETDHTNLIASPQDALAVVPIIPTMYDEPFADSSQIPTHLVSRMAREHVTVALSGDGGDELFGGYDRYRQLDRLARVRERLPSGLRHLIGRGMLAMPVSLWDTLGASLLGRAFPPTVRHRTGHRAHKTGRVLTSDRAVDLYDALMSVDDDADRMVIGGHRASDRVADIQRVDSITGLTAGERAMLVDTLSYLPDDLLTKVDRASMAVSLEVRAPFLDPELFRFAWSLRSDQRIRGGQGKWLIRQFLSRCLPAALINRPKMGFGVPVGEWLRGPLRPWADDLLDQSLLIEQGYLNPESVRACWQGHLDRDADFTYRLWSILMFQAWLVEAGP